MKRGSDEWFKHWESKFSSEKQGIPKTKRLQKTGSFRELDVQSQWEEEINAWKGELEIKADQGDAEANKRLGNIEFLEKAGGKVSPRDIKEAIEAASAPDKKHPNPSYHRPEAAPPPSAPPPSQASKQPPARSQSMPASPRSESPKPAKASSSTSSMLRSFQSFERWPSERRSPDLLRKQAVHNSRSSRSVPSTPAVSRKNSASESPEPEKKTFEKNTPEYYKGLEQMYDDQKLPKDDIRAVKIEHAKSIINKDGSHIDAIKEAYGENHDEKAAKEKILEIVIKDKGPPLDNASLDSVFKEFEPEPKKSYGM